MVSERSSGRHAEQQADNSLRLCAATRASRPPGELIRFVSGPGRTIVPDLARRLPGRGVWVTADRDSITRAIASRAFARSLKAAVEVPSDLADQVERLMVRRVADALSLANKAGAVLAGFDKIDRRIAAGGLVALVHASDAAQDGRGRLDRKFMAVEGPDAAGRIVAVLTVEQMSLAIGRPNVVHAGLNKGGASDRVLAEAGRLMRYRSGFGHSLGHAAERPDASEDAREASAQSANMDPLEDPNLDA
ncbi:MAG: RNA-binding protein [Hyphomicrobiaceae bacterium]|nr:RNA-binding protein [Hyphomicrobiaceae bacterium]